jgi:hypothetical protein
MSTPENVALLHGCRWVDPPVDDDGNWSIATKLGFESPRLFWLTSIARGQWRGRHAHRYSILATFAVSGSCRLTLDDAREKQIVDLKERGPGLVIDPWIWHDLYDFSEDAAILVIASTRYDESDYIRDYETFVKEARRR